MFKQLQGNLKMPILEITPIAVGLVGVNPRIVMISTNDTVAEITTAGYLNKAVQQGFAFAESDMCLVSTKTSPSAHSTQVGFYDVSHSGTNWSLTADASTFPLANAHIYVGNAGGVATDVAMTGDISITNAGVTAIVAGVIVNADINASAAIAFSKFATLATGHILAGNGGVVTDVALSGDATIGATGVLTIAANAITTAKILDANVTLAKLAAGIAPSHVVKFGAQHTTVGGNAAEAITVTGALATDLAFVQMVNDGTANVTIVNAVVTSNTLTITFSADPGNDCIINYQLLRAAV